jgi:hypothetical protein
MVAIALGGFCALATAEGSDRVILDPRDHPVRTGTYSRFAEFQQKLWRLLAECARGGNASVPKREPWGTLGPDTAEAIQRALHCPGFETMLSVSPARGGVLTLQVWQSVMGREPIPHLQDLVDAIVLSFEATDFSDKPEWNFCQDSPKEDLPGLLAGSTQSRCFNASDPCSLLTWGPRGATAGQGREIQWILFRIWRREPSLLRQAFGAEMTNVRRFLRLKGPPPDRCNGDSPVEHFMCAVWIDPMRRSAWEHGLVALGRSAAVRRVFRDVYASDEFDGNKLRAYYHLWEELGLPPSEIDYAFFYDRATHIGAPPQGLTSAALKLCIDGQSAARTAHAAARRCLSQQHPHPTLPSDRYARDIAFYIDGYPREALSKHEIEAWIHHIPLAAGKNFALSDDRPVPLEKVVSGASAGKGPPQDFVHLTDAERACPTEIRVPIRSRPPIRDEVK